MNMEGRHPASVLAYSIKPKRRLSVFAIRGACFVAGIAVLYGALSTSVRTVSYWMDPETRAVKMQTEWLGYKLSPVVTETALDQRLAVMGIAHTHTWQFCSEAESKALGTVRGCGIAPKIMQCPPQMLLDFVDHASDSEVKQFVQTMSSGTDAQQQAAIDAAADRALGSR
jgi:hypothetical protein